MPRRIFYQLFVLVAVFQLTFTQRRVKGGKDVLGNKRYMVYLLAASTSPNNYKGWMCGGAIISKDFVITSAACVEDVKHMYVVAGYKTYVPSDKMEEDQCVTQKRKKVIQTCIPKEYNLDYNKTEIWARVDIALVKVESPFDFNDTSYETICSYTPDKIDYNIENDFPKPGHDVIVLGWGHSKEFRKDTDFKDMNQKTLQYAPAKVLDEETCVKHYKGNTALASFISSSMICTLGQGNLDDKGKPISVRTCDSHESSFPHNSLILTKNIEPDETDDTTKKNKRRYRQYNSFFNRRTGQNKNNTRKQFYNYFSDDIDNLRVKSPSEERSSREFNIFDPSPSEGNNPDVITASPTSTTLMFEENTEIPTYPLTTEEAINIPTFPEEIPDIPKPEETPDILEPEETPDFLEPEEIPDIPTNPRISEEITEPATEPEPEIEETLPPETTTETVTTTTEYKLEPTTQEVKTVTDDFDDILSIIPDLITDPSPDKTETLGEEHVTIPIDVEEVTETLIEDVDTPGICQNDHGGPLITWRGPREILVAVATLYKLDNKYQCMGPYLFTKTSCNSKFLECMLNTEEHDEATRRNCEDPIKLGFHISRRHISWIGHRDGPAENEQIHVRQQVPMSAYQPGYRQVHRLLPRKSKVKH